MKILASPAGGSPMDNPYAQLLYGQLSRGGDVVVEQLSWRSLLRHRGAIVHLHWPEHHLNNERWIVAIRRTSKLLTQVALGRLLRGRVVLTVHNLHSHGRRHPGTEHWFWWTLVRLVDAWISLSPPARQEALRHLPRLAARPNRVILHGHYRGMAGASTTAAEARQELQLPGRGPVLGCVGRIEPYKGTDRLAACFARLPMDDATLLVAGECTSRELRRMLESSSDGDPRIRLRLAPMEDRVLALHIRACDLVVLPFTRILNSGSALLALSLDRPILVPHHPTLSWLQDTVGPDWVYTYQGRLSTGALVEALSQVVAHPPGPRAPLDAFDPGLVADETRRFFRELMDVAPTASGKGPE